MRLKIFRPHQALRPFVNFYWYLEPDYDRDHRLLPGGVCCDIIIQIGPPASYKKDGDEWQLRRINGFVEGNWKSYFLLRFYGTSRLAGIRFKSTGLYPFVRTPVKEFTEQFIDLASVFGNQALELVDKVAEMLSINKLPKIFDEFLLKKLVLRQETDIRLERAVQIMVQQRGVTSIRGLTRRISMSERCLERSFDRYIGLSPQQFATIQRLNHFISLAKNPNRPAFTQLAHECGFADQSHLIRIFKRHTGLPPREYFRQQNELQQKLNEETF